MVMFYYKRLKDGVLKGLQTSEGTPCDFSEDENYTFEEISEEEYQNLLTTYFLTKTKVSKFEEENKVKVEEVIYEEEISAAED